MDLQVHTTIYPIVCCAINKCTLSCTTVCAQYHVPLYANLLNNTLLRGRWAFQRKRKGLLGARHSDGSYRV